MAVNTQHNLPCRNNKLCKKSKGFTLIEAVVAIVILGIAMVTLTSFLAPQIADSARPHYEVRASTLAHSMMTEVLARGFDEHSDFLGGALRCGEAGAATCSTTSQFGPDSANNEVDETTQQRFPENFNDVDDYIGCWYSNTASENSCGSNAVGSLNDIFGNNIADDYPNFSAIVSVEYASDIEPDLGLDPAGANPMKLVLITIHTERYGDFSLSAYRGNY